MRRAAIPHTARFMDALLTGRTAVVTGAASGNGRAIARRFAEEGADVVVADVREEPRLDEGPPTHDLVESETDARSAFVECDVSSESDVEAAMEAAAAFGGIDIMVNNAAIYRREAFLEVSEAEFDRMIDVNVKGTFLGTQAAAERMVDGEGGAIVNLSSVAGLEGSGDFVTYCTSKGAVRLLTYAAADALGPEEIRVNAIHPGVIETAMTTDDVPIVDSEVEEAFRRSIPSRHFGTPDDIADAALYLASDLSRFVNGESLVVDGGMTNTG
jgi:NAD(P)-dependent dehydrogenase (short-subunit alcohol dehydrogenase family)